MVRHENRHDREADGAIQWRLPRQKRQFTFLKYGGDTSTDRDWIDHIRKGSNKTRFQYCQNSCNTFLYIRAIQEHTGGDVIELMGDVATPFNRKQFHFYRGCSFNLKSILEARRIGGGKESREGRQTVFFTPLDPFGRKFQVDLSKPGKVHNKTGWKRAQDAVYWIQGTRKRYNIWANAIIAFKTVPPDCIERVISHKGETTFFQRLSAPRPVPRIILKNALNQQRSSSSSSKVTWKASGN